MRLLKRFSVISGFLAIGAPSTYGQAQPPQTLYLVHEDANVISEPYYKEPAAVFLPGVPSDWTTPVDYVNGATMHMRIEVVTLKLPIIFTLQLNDDPNFSNNVWTIYPYEAPPPSFGGWTQITSPGVYTMSVPVTWGWKDDVGGFHWTNINYWSLILWKDAPGQHIRTDPAYLPMRILFKAAVVPAGGALDPAFWTSHGVAGTNPGTPPPPGTMPPPGTSPPPGTVSSSASNRSDGDSDGKCGCGSIGEPALTPALWGALFFALCLAFLCRR